MCLCWPDALDSPGVELMGHCELFDVGFRNWTQVVSKSLNAEPSPTNTFFLHSYLVCECLYVCQDMCHSVYVQFRKQLDSYFSSSAQVLGIEVK